MTNKNDQDLTKRVVEQTIQHTHPNVSPVPKVRYQRLYADVVLPEKETVHAAGRDIRAYLIGSRIQLSHDGGLIERGPDESVEVPFINLYPGQRASIPTGFKMAIPPGFEMQVRPRNATSLIKGLSIPNAPGAIDSGHRDEVRIIVRNDTQVCVPIEHGETIAQFVLAAVADLPDEEVELLDAPRSI